MGDDHLTECFVSLEFGVLSYSKLIRLERIISVATTLPSKILNWIFSAA
jgi:hypothetical protein